ncbi:MAG: hydantoinase B/oxoprolinase family protein [Actinomycetota bacterium]|nr:hydantoinase B/oxoprolinase family protein [Actinomycetota bacterium]
MSLDPISLGVQVGRFRAVCDEMGAVLIRAAHSPNIKERRDCSTALFDPGGELVMQAEHIPVHLGSMPDAVRAIIGSEQRPGESWILNDPFRGGTHLPDITLITPVFADGELAGYVASRAHHADVGGPAPGSMPASSRSLDEEGVVIQPTRVTGAAELGELTSGMRNRPQRVADLRAQLAANDLGARRLGALIDADGLAGVTTAMGEILDYTERRTRTRLAELPDGSWSARDVLEGGPDGSEDIELRVTATIDGDSLHLDFAGSADQVEGNLNCPLSVTRSAAFFCVRVLLDPDAPPSAGAHRPVAVSAPAGSILDARPGAAVAGGNVETSSRVADLVFGALAGVASSPAQGQGTMNNLTLAGTGTSEWTYYETLGGGQGACPRADGPSAIHVAMSNTLNTPVEALETELPLRVRQVSIRRGSGGAGEHRGGDGLIRELQALEPMAYSLITERRRHPPGGRDGGSAGQPGRNSVSGEPVPAKATGELRRGDVLRIETPGGGGFGPPSKEAGA